MVPLEPFGTVLQDLYFRVKVTIAGLIVLVIFVAALVIFLDMFHGP